MNAHSADFDAGNSPANSVPKFIAEISSNHNQDLGRSLEMIDAASEAGFDAVKFQLFEIDKLFTEDVVAKSEAHRARRAWELPRSFVPELAGRASSLGLEFSCTPFDLGALAFIEPWVDFIKIASYELLWSDLISAAGRTGKPVIISTGMATIDEVTEATTTLRDAGCVDITILHCVSEYPAEINNCNLSAISTLKNTWGEKTGWSDHSASEAIILAAAFRWQSDVIELHFDLDGAGREFGPGHCWLPQESQRVISLVRTGASAAGTGIKIPAASEQIERLWRADPTDGLRPLKEARRDDSVGG